MIERIAEIKAKSCANEDDDLLRFDCAPFPRCGFGIFAGGSTTDPSFETSG
jgi:hypothetical protein